MRLFLLGRVFGGLEDGARLDGTIAALGAWRAEGYRLPIVYSYFEEDEQMGKLDVYLGRKNCSHIEILYMFN